MEIGIFSNAFVNNLRGPYKVYLNLKKGLEKLGYKVRDNTLCSYNGCLNHNSLSMGLPPQTLMGPNLMVWPSDIPEYFKRYNNFIMPSKWVLELYTSSPICINTKLFVWPVGIDTDLFCNTNKNIQRDCIIYYKNRSIEDLNKVTDLLRRTNSTYTVIEYGKYTEETFKEVLRTSSYAILLTNTESQGIGYMEILSSNIPCFVFDTIDYCGYKATSVPYFDYTCGIISDFSKDYISEFLIFLQNLNNYSPREYITKNHNLELSAKKYVEKVLEINNVRY